METLYRELADHHLTVQSTSGDEYAVCCPFHGEQHASMRFNVVKGVFFCHGCGVKGTASALAKFLGVPFINGRDPETQMSILRSKLDALSRKPDEQPARRFWPEERLDRFKRMPCTYWSDPVPFGRGFTEKTIEAFDLGYDPLEAQAIIPIRDLDGQIIGVTRRDLAAGKRSYRDPKGFIKAENLFGSWLVKESMEHYVVLMEGPLDAVKGWQSGHPSVAQYGSKLTARQIRLLRLLGITTVILCYDNDKAGQEAVEYSFGWRTALNRQGQPQVHYVPECDLRSFFVVKQCEYPTRLKVKDPGEMEDEDLGNMICDAKYVGYTRRQ